VTVRARRLPAARAALVVVGLAVSAVFAYLAVRGVRWGDVWVALRDSRLGWLAPAFAALAVAVYLRALRWRSLFLPESRPPVRAVVSALLVGLFFNSVLPARAGEAARVVALNQSAGTSRAEAAATVVLERVMDVLALLVLLFVALPWLPHVSWVRAAGLLGLVLVLGVAGVIVVLARFGERPLRFVVRPLGLLPFVGAERLDAAAANAGSGLAGLRRPRIALEAAAWTIAGWLLLALSAWLLTRAFVAVSPLAGVLVVVATNLAMILPASPGALGVFEAAALVALKAYRVPHSRALSYALVLHVLNVMPFIVVGAVVLQRHAARVRRSRSTA
jgi:uncharacterized membrane protein YbhN (UPF0104 family)